MVSRKHHFAPAITLYYYSKGRAVCQGLFQDFSEKKKTFRFGGCAAQQSGEGKSRWGRRSRFRSRAILSGTVVEYAERRKVSFGKAAFRPRHSRGRRAALLCFGLCSVTFVFSSRRSRAEFSQNADGEPLCLDVIAPKRLGGRWTGEKTKDPKAIAFGSMERITGLEPATSTLARSRSTK